MAVNDDELSEMAIEELDQACRSREIDRVALITNEPLDRAFYNYLALRAQHY